MIVTSVRLHILPSSPNKVRAIGSVVLDECFQIEHVHIVEMDDGKMIVAMPSKFEHGKYHDVAHPITSEFRRHITRTVLTEYHSRLTDSKSQANITNGETPTNADQC